MTRVLKDSMNHYAIEVKRGPKHAHCIVRMAGEVEYKSFPLTKMIVDHEYHTEDGTHQFDRRWEPVPYPDAVTEEDRRVAGIKDLQRVVDCFLNGTLPITPKARRWLEALRDNPAASEPLHDSTQPTEEGEVTMSTKKAKTKKAPKEKKDGVCAKVHTIADKLGKEAARADVIEACVKAGINKATAGTQYQKWLHRKN